MMSDIVSDGINDEPQRGDNIPQLDFCRRHYTKCIIVGATSMIFVTATVITCAVVVGYKISKETITFQYGTVVFKTTDNTTVVERISVHGSGGQKDAGSHGQAMIVFDYPHFLMLIHFSKFDGVCFVTQMNETWTKIFGLKHGHQTVSTTDIPESIWYLRTQNQVDRNLIPVSIRHACWQHSYWMTETEHNFKGDPEQNSRASCKPLCLTFCFSPKSPCIKVCLYNPCIKRTTGILDTVSSVNRTGVT